MKTQTNAYAAGRPHRGTAAPPLDVENLALNGIRAIGERGWPDVTLKRENRDLKRANEILRKASACFGQAELDGRPIRWSRSSTSIVASKGSSRSARCCRSPRRSTSNTGRKRSDDDRAHSGAVGTPSWSNRSNACTA
jgi:hypothetical protein